MRMASTRGKHQTGRERLRAWIERGKYDSDKQAAETLGVHPVVLSQWLSGERVPGLDNAVMLEQVTGISVESWLLNDISHDEEPVNATAKRPKQTGR